MTVMTFLLERIRAWRTDFIAIRMPNHNTAKADAIVGEVPVHDGGRRLAVDHRALRKNCARQNRQVGKICAKTNENLPFQGNSALAHALQYIRVNMLITDPPRRADPANITRGGTSS